MYVVPDLKNNLFSIGKLQEKGLAILIQYDKCRIYHREKGLIILAEMTTSRIFILSAASQPKKPVCFHSEVQDLSHLWHYRCGHLSHNGLNIHQRKEMLHGLPKIEASTTV